jgi:ATP-dependent DNA helicase DinG
MSIELIEQIFAEDGTIKKFKPNYIPRPSQIEASKMLYQALEGKSHSLVEGPCGFGKTFSYLIPLCLAIRQGLCGRAIITTNGIALSEQLVYQDLPMISDIIGDITGWRPKYGLFKGKGNFLCQRKFFDPKGLLIEESVKRRLEEFVKSSKSGDLSDLDITLQYQDLQQISCTAEGECMGSACPCNKTCYYQTHKRMAMGSDIILTNYHMLFSDWQSENGVLPEFDVLVMDEAHEAAAIFRDFAQEEFSSTQIIWARNKINKLLQERTFLSERVPANPETKEYLFHEKMSDLSTELQQLEKTMGQEVPRFSNYLLIDTQMPLYNEIAVRKAANICETMLFELVMDFDSLLEMYRDNATVQADVYAVRSALSRAYGKILNIRCFFEERVLDDFQKKYVYYIEKSDNNNQQIKLAKKHIKVDDIMRHAFFENDKISSAILTSATLSVGGNFKYIRSELGLTDLEDKEVLEFIGQSPFDLTHQQLWFMPEGCADGDNKHKQQYDESLDSVVTQIVDAVGGGILFLCTSYSNMKAIFDIVRMNDTVIQNDITVLRQGEVSNKRITEFFKDDRDSILVATRSFFTGIDVPGDALRCVVIDKLPFPSPAEPVMAKLSKEENSFNKYYVPVMIMTLKQAVGRGVRSIHDKCVIAFMDNRMKTARYRTRIIDSFPYEKTATRFPDQVREFLKEE